MDFNFHDLLPDNFDANSRVWIYQSNRLFTMQEALKIEDLLESFVSSWNSHGTLVKGYANLLFGQFIVFIADESAHGVSGCSTDSSVRLIKDIEQTFRVNMFDRLMLAFVAKEKIQMVPIAQLSYALENNFIDGATLYFNNTVLNLQDLRNNWIIPVSNSWLNTDRRYTGLINKISAV
jgi:hypothetical protein